MQISDMTRQGTDQMPEKAEVSIEWRTTLMRRKKKCLNINIYTFIV